MTPELTPKSPENALGLELPEVTGEVISSDFRVYTEVGPGGWMVIPPQKAAIRITGLAEGGCRVEMLDE